MRHFRLHGWPQSPGGWLAEWPRWKANTIFGRHVPEEVQDILDAYASLEASLDSTVETTDSLNLADVDSPVDVIPSASTTAEPVTPIESITAYDRGAIDQFLHENLQLLGNSQAFEALGNFFAALNAPARNPPSMCSTTAIRKLKVIGSPDTCATFGNPFGAAGAGVFPTALSHSHVGHAAIMERRMETPRSIWKKTRPSNTIGSDSWPPSPNHVPPQLIQPQPYDLRFEPHPRGYRRNRAFNQVHLALGQVNEPTTCN